jgi:hypothetical protein
MLRAHHERQPFRGVENPLPLRFIGKGSGRLRAERIQPIEYVIEKGDGG